MGLDVVLLDLTPGDLALLDSQRRVDRLDMGGPEDAVADEHSGAPCASTAARSTLRNAVKSCRGETELAKSARLKYSSSTADLLSESNPNGDVHRDADEEAVGIG